MSKKAVTHNYAFVFYDIAESRCQKVFKVCKQYFAHHQLSVFRGRITPSALIEFQDKLKKIIVEDEDTISIVTIMNENMINEITIGENKKDGESLII